MAARVNRSANSTTISSWATSPRSRNVMLGNRSRNTQPELAVRRLIYARGLRYRVNFQPFEDYRRSADIVFTRDRVAIFIDGCFWHSCPLHGTTSKSNVAYWKAKLSRNVDRDCETTRIFEEHGWMVMRYWEHEDPHRVANAIAQEIAKRREADPPSMTTPDL